MCLLAAFLRLSLSFGWRELPDKKSELRTLAFADLCAELGRAVIGEPVTRVVAFAERRFPQNQRIDASIGVAILAQWPAGQAGSLGAIDIRPRLAPRRHAGRDRGRDSVSHKAILILHNR